MMNEKYHKKHNKMHHIRKNYALKYIYNDENECINDTLSVKILSEGIFLKIKTIKIIDNKGKGDVCGRWEKPIKKFQSPFKDKKILD